MSEFQQTVKDGLKTIGRRIRKALWVILGIIVVGAILTLWISSWTYSDGSRAGYLIKISHKGVVFKTFEGQLNTGGFSQQPDEAVMGNIWEFSVTKDEIYKQLQELEGQKVTLQYKQRYKSYPWQAKTEYIVYGVEKVEE